MKKLILPVLAIGAIATLASCSSEEPLGPGANDGKVTFNICLEGAQTRAFGETTDCNEIYYTVFDMDGNVVLADEHKTAFGPGVNTATVELQLVANQDYQVIFYAHNSGSEFSKYENGVVTVDYTKMNVNSTLDDAFINKKDYTPAGGTKVDNQVFTADGNAKTVYLTRPFAQVNFGTDDLDNTAVQKIISGVTTTFAVSKGLNNTYTVIGGKASGTPEYPVTASTTTAPEDNPDFPVEPATYDNLLSVYLLVPQAQDMIDATYTINLAGKPAINNLNLANMPVQGNYRTNVYGSLLTTQNQFNVTIEPNFGTPSYEVTFKPKSASELSEALTSPTNAEIQIDQNLDASTLAPEDFNLTGAKKIVIAEDATLTMPASAYFTTSQDLTIQGGTITNDGANTRAGESEPAADGSKGIFRIYGGDFTLEGVTIVNDMDYHYHGSKFNSAAIAYWNDANITIINSTIKSGEFTLCGMGRGVASGVITLKDSYFESTSSSAHNGKNWSYALRLFGTSGTMDNCTVKGTQGGLSTDSQIKLTINSGLYYTVNSPGKQDAFYPLYITDGSEVTINGGYFYGAMKRTGLNIEGNSCVVSGDNDVNLPSGTAIINGGYFNGKAYNEAGLIVLPTGYKYESCSEVNDGMTFTWKVVKE